MPSAPRRLFCLVDCSDFYISCERLFRPDLARTPTAVLSNNDGCIVARSEEVKRLGIAMGAPFFKVREELEAAPAVVFSSNYELYGDLSRCMIDTLQTFSPDVEMYSIAETKTLAKVESEYAKVLRKRGHEPCVSLYGMSA